MNYILPYRRTPIQELRNHPVVEKAGVRLLIKREDLNHRTVTGNKWWKLKYNLEAVYKTPHRTLLTFGGAYSNHIYATAAAASELGLKSIGIIRGEEHASLNPTLQFAKENGMHLHYVDRATYRKGNSPEFHQQLIDRFGQLLIIPEGGSNLLALKGCAEFATSELARESFDHLYLAVGTGGTMAGIICGFEDEKNIVGVSVLKGGGFLEQTVAKMISDFSGKLYRNWSLLTDFHHGGYAKTTAGLNTFIHEMRQQYDLPLDHVYTGKLLWATLQQIQSGAFRRGDTVLILHSGGLQGAMSSKHDSFTLP